MDELLICWRDAEDEAGCAYRRWRERPGYEADAVYRAAADRADAALRELARSATRNGIDPFSDEAPPAVPPLASMSRPAARSGR
jgi:acyl-CoA reductase-like NAD-dependent aldehyde dehydrogenase